MKNYIFSSAIGLLVLTLVQFLTLSGDNTELKVYFLDVGQGDSSLITYPTGERLLIDTGKDSKVFRSLDKVLPWYDKTIEYVLITHGDSDHLGAMLDILDRYQVQKVFVSQFFGQIEIEKDILERLKEEGVIVEVVTQGDMLTFGTSVQNSFEIMHPDPNCFERNNQSENECSLVSLLTYGAHSFLFTGDIGKKVETEIKDNIPSPLTVLKVAHHGSNGSSDLDFLLKIKPQYSVISYGENSYGHPHLEVIERLTLASSTIFKTKEDATIVASSDGTTFEIKSLFDKSSFFESSICSVLLYGFDTSC